MWRAGGKKVGGCQKKLGGGLEKIPPMRKKKI
jgi:hypothetical protein